MLPQQPVDLLDKPVTKQTPKSTAPAKEKIQKKTETPPTPRTKPVLQLETDPVPPQKDEKTTTEAIKVAKAEAGTKEASLVDAGAEGADKGVTSGEVKGSGVKSEITDVLESGATSEGDVAGDGERGVATTMPTNDTSPPAGSDLNELLIGTTGGLTDGNKSPSQGQTPSTFGVTFGFESLKGADEVVGSTNANSLWDDDIWS